jgi:manganese/zinc/iron transport system substrate-binding protein
MTPDGRIKVLSSIGMIHDIVQEVGGDHVDGHILIQGDLDPHSYQLVKGDGEKIAFADLIFYVGLGLEHGPSIQKQLHDDDKSVALGDHLHQQDSDSILVYNGTLDPHIWMDISLWSKTIPTIVETLSRHDPQHAEEYQRNGDKLIKQLQQEHENTRRFLQNIPEEKRYLVTSHDAFNYFAKAYLTTEEELKNNDWQKRFAAPEGLAPDSQLSSADIQSIIDHLSMYNIQVLFPESNLSRDSISKIVDAGKEKGLNLYIASCALYGDAMGRPGTDGDSYVKMLRHNTRTIGKYLKDYNPRIECEEIGNEEY